MSDEITLRGCAKLVQDNAGSTNTVLQLLSLGQPDTSNTADPNCFRAVVSDKAYAIPVMLSLYLSPRIESGEIGPNKIIRVRQFMKQEIDQMCIIIITKLDVIAAPPKKLGVPYELSPFISDLTIMFGPGDAADMADDVVYPSPRNDGFFRITDLRPGMNGWVIRVRVIRNTGRFTTSSGIAVVNYTFVDETSMMSGVAFGDTAVSLFEDMQLNEVYSITNAKVQAPSEYYQVGSPYQLKFTKDTQIQHMSNIASIPQNTKRFLKIQELPANLNTIQDVVGVINFVGKPIDFTKSHFEQQRKPGNSTWMLASQVRDNHLNEIETFVPKKVREVGLIDDSLHGTRLGLWGDVAESFSATEGTVMVLRDVRVCNFGGASLNIEPTTSITFEEDLPEVDALREWHDNGGKNATFTLLSDGVFGASASKRMSVTMHHNGTVTISEMLKKTPAQIGLGELFNTIADITMIRTDTIGYNGCITTGCNGGVKPDNNDPTRSWCNTCKHTMSGSVYKYFNTYLIVIHSDFHRRYRIGVRISDGLNSIHCTIFDPLATTMIGLNATKLEELRFKRNPEFDTKLDALKRKWKLCCAAKIGKTGTVLYTITRAERHDNDVV
ncbi:hypothetical protein CALCODRAFT_505920 [Calocera cornea HHB12733]|uniref:Replication protein A subunit n=1 Tax=Calocera cornea HHB12733 TaxID=1353952 RepID=A0A165JGT8_9BASI|nr:hypothetical protein CALCODRAFT_505920 [Calocera cornea HHB12733]